MKKYPECLKVKRHLLGDDDSPRTLYHAFPASLLDKVMAEGLVPSTQGVSNFGGNVNLWCIGKLFLSWGYLAATRWQGYLEEQLGIPIAIVSVQLDHVKDLYEDVEAEAMDFYTTEPIAAKYLTVETKY